MDRRQIGPLRRTGRALGLAIALALATTLAGLAIASPWLAPAPSASPTTGADGATPGRSPAASATPTTPTATPTATVVPTAGPTPTATPLTFGATPVSPWIAGRLQAALDRSTAAIGSPGAAAAVILADGRTWSGGSGFANLTSRIPMTGTTVFSIASMGKPLVAVVVLELAAEGRLGLNDSVAAHLPDLTLLGQPIDPRITIRQLLDHTSGLGDFLTSPQLAKAVEADPSARWTVEQALAYLRPPVAAPGERYFYSNANYVLLGLIVEATVGHSLAREVRDRIADPLGLRSLFYQGVDPVPGTLAVAYRFSSSRLDATPRDVSDPSGIRPFAAITTASGAAGSFAASPEDLALAYRGIFSGTLAGRAILTEMVIDATRQTAILPATPNGLGVQVYTVDGWTTFGHSGRLVGAQGVTRYVPALGATISVMTNQSRYDPLSIYRALLAEVAPLAGTAKPALP